MSMPQQPNQPRPEQQPGVPNAWQGYGQQTFSQQPYGQQPYGQQPPPQGTYSGQPSPQPPAAGYPSSTYPQPDYPQPTAQPQPAIPGQLGNQPPNPFGASIGASDELAGSNSARVDIDERPAWSSNGFIWLGCFFILGIVGIILITLPTLPQIFGILMLLAALVIITGITVVSPGTTRVVQFFGRYIGTIRQTGIVMTVPVTKRTNVSVKVRNFETNELKVNDADGNPVNIAAIVVWQVADTAKSVFAVEDYRQFVLVQSESALRHVAGSHPYDNAAAGEETLRGSTETVAAELASEVAERISIAGLKVVETRISSLSYAPEIAQAMLQRQQASAMIAAREKIVEGAVSMVQNALTKLDKENVVSLDEASKAAMVSNLLVVLCSDSRATPVVNAGTSY